jgi:hypothetical protein
MAALLLAASLLLIHRCVNAPHYHYDDSLHMQVVFERSWPEVLEIDPRTSAFPVTVLSHRLDKAIFGAVPPSAAALGDSDQSSLDQPPRFTYPTPPTYGLRIMNALYHAAAGFFLFLFLGRIGVTTGLAAVIALVWTVHPMACESVCWVSERKNVLVAFFGFAALWAWAAGRWRTDDGETGGRGDGAKPTAENGGAEPIRNPQSAIRNRSWRWPAVTVLFALACFSKPSAVGLMPVFVALELLDPPEGSFRFADVRGWFTAALRLAPVFAVGVACIAAGIKYQAVDIVDPPGGSVWTALLTDTEIVARYIKNILVPVDLSFFYAVTPAVSLTDWRVWVYGALILGILAVCVWAAGAQRRRVAVLGAVWFIAALGPNANLVGIPFWMQDRYAYIAAAGLLVLVGTALAGLAERLGKDGQLLPRMAWVWPAGIALATLVRAPLFESSKRLSLEAIRSQPNSAIARLSAASYLKEDFRRYSAPGNGNPLLAEMCGKAIYALYEDIENCADLYCHIDRFTLAVQKAEALVSLNRMEEARATLGDVPPKDLPMFRRADERGEMQHRMRRDATRSYLPVTLAIAWQLLGEIDLRQSSAPGRKFEEKVTAAREAIREADEASAVHTLNSVPRLLKARALIRLSDVYADHHDMTAAMKHYSEGIAELKGISPLSPSAPVAQDFLSKLTPPKEAVEEKGRKGEGEKRQ